MSAFAAAPAVTCPDRQHAGTDDFSEGTACTRARPVHMVACGATHLFQY
jgi:hypothetical protein